MQAEGEEDEERESVVVVVVGPLLPGGRGGRQ